MVRPTRPSLTGLSVVVATVQAAACITKQRNSVYLKIISTVLIVVTHVAIGESSKELAKKKHLGI